MEPLVLRRAGEPCVCLPAAAGGFPQGRKPPQRTALAQGFRPMEHPAWGRNGGLKCARWNLSPQEPQMPVLFLLPASTTAERHYGCKHQDEPGFHHRAGARQVRLLLQCSEVGRRHGKKRPASAEWKLLEGGVCDPGAGRFLEV